MTHQQILDNLAARHLVQSVDEDLARLIARTMSYAKHDKKIAGDPLAFFLPKMLLRWDCILKADHAEVSDNYKQKAILAIAVSLHKYGFADKSITDNAIKAIDNLNQSVALSDDFFRKTDKIKALISSPPVELKRKPATPDSITFYRPKDVVSIQLGKKYYCAYIHELSSPNESPVVEFYDSVFDKVPTLPALENIQAKGRVYNDGIKRISKYSIAGMKFLPDLANQIKLVSACVETPPSNKDLQESIGLYAVCDIFDIQDDIKRMFGEQDV
ncbi:hypothetical protein [Chitinophaga vietnamensis]|uniref:hypothetical protein n=1 Tax=Chitinophaga vietnamensis TaxID=2593957 RepID=UPI001177B86C|nr:hypothetical protein [Chitinophaga vietnamensis]